MARGSPPIISDDIQLVTNGLVNNLLLAVDIEDSSKSDFFQTGHCSFLFLAKVPDFCYIK